MLGTAKGDANKQKLGEHLIVGGLVVQLIFFGFFMLVSVLFWTRYHKGEVVDKTVVDATSGGRWRSLMKALFGSSLLILVRSVFRVVEYLGGYNGYLLTKEVFLYVFDGTLMFLVMVMFNWCFPGKVIQRRKEQRGVEGGYAMNR